MPSGVFMVTSDSVTATALATFGSIIAMPAPSSTPNCRRVTIPRSSNSCSVVVKMILVAHVSSSRTRGRRAALVARAGGLWCVTLYHRRSATLRPR